MHFLVRFYQRFISPFLGPRCRFVPTCSEYALEAIDRHGQLRGSYLAIRRILRCHPWGSCGYDPVPEHFSWRTPAESRVKPSSKDTR